MIWQPIETAPKDGTTILGADFCSFTNQWNISTVSWDGAWSLVITGAYAEDDKWNPTHWMPLPTPPEQEQL
jgi:hypothetical protein